MERAKYDLIVIGGETMGKMFKLVGDEMVIGRSPDAHVFLEDDGVSRRHARIERAELGEIGVVLDPVMPVEMLEEAVQLGNEAALEAGRIEPAAEQRPGRGVECGRLAAQAGVDVEPEVGELAEIGVGAPAGLRMGRAEIGDVVADAPARREGGHAAARIRSVPDSETGPAPTISTSTMSPTFASVTKWTDCSHGDLPSICPAWRPCRSTSTRQLRPTVASLNAF